MSIVQRGLNWWAQSTAGDYYRGLGERDRRIVQGLAILLAAMLFWALIWRPIHNWREDSAARYADSVQLLQWLHDNEAQARQSSSRGAGGGAGDSSLAVVGNVARELGITLTRFQPEGDSGVSVVLQEEEFDKVLRFVDQLESRHGMTVRQFSFDRQSPGHVTARIVIR